MSALTWFYLAAGGWVLAAAAALAGRGAPRLIHTACVLSGLAGAAGIAGGASALWWGNSRVVSAGGSVIVGTLQLQASSLAGAFAALLGLVALAIAAYAFRYHEAGPHTAIYLAVFNLACLGCLAVLAAANVVTFLVAWESVALLCYLLILRHPGRTDVAGGAFWFLALSETGFVLLVAAFVILAAKTHSMQLDLIATRAHLVPAGWRDAAYLLALTGFGFKAGLVPLHVWLPEAHPVAPADGSAFLSGLVVNLGAYGIALFAFRLLPVGPAWLGLLTMGAGAITAAIGILYALNERDLKRFLAFSTIENTGIIVTAFGAAMTFGAYGQRALWAFLLLAGLYHVANHGTYKTLLFLEAGVIEHTTGTRDMDRLGGLIHRLPRSAVITLIGTLGIAALPPLNGFVSEWLIFQGLFQGFRTGSHLVGILIVVAAATLGLTGGLAIYAFVRGYGIPFLGMARTRQSAEAAETGQPVAGPGLLAVACVALAVGAPLVVLALSRAVGTVTGVTLRPDLLPGNLTIIPAHTDFSAFSPTYLTVFLVAVTVVPVLIYLSGRPGADSVTVPVWDGGMVTFRPRMQYSAMTFSAPTRVTFDALYRPSVSMHRASDDPAGRSGPVHYETEVTPVFQRYLYTPVVRAVEWLADVIRPMQSGDVNVYLLYLFLVILAAYLIGAL
ncbi:MAG TPA: proton-conducting transporter membrane subunit [Streptosporangiaceae bacterium]|nr:proton-conducting transporter membrane subunit [Streptosporangiaceae bacterium]